MFKRTAASVAGALTLLPLLAGAASPITASADTLASSNVNFTANIVSGGAKVTAQNVDFGEMKIGQAFPAKAVTGLATLTNLTGASIDLSVAETDYKAHASNFGFTLDDTPLTDASMPIYTMPGTDYKAAKTIDKTVSGKWGDKPTPGAVRGTVVWTVAPTPAK